MKTASAEKPRILIVEDDEGVREGLRELLTDSDFDVVGEAEDGARGVDLAEQLDPDVVLMDMRMPVMGGVEAARRIHRQRPDVQVVILTAYDDPALKAEAVDAGVYAFLVKGCSGRLISEVATTAFKMRRSMQESDRV
jgi:two-component system invasion response regulator UvrY